MQQWDSFLRLAFGGKNKTLRANLTSNKSYIAQLAQWRVPTCESTMVNGALNVREVPASASEQDLVATREEVQAALDDAEASSKRPNALPLLEFRRVFASLASRGFRFLPPPRAAPKHAPSAPAAAAAVVGA